MRSSLFIKVLFFCFLAVSTSCAKLDDFLLDLDIVSVEFSDRIISLEDENSGSLTLSDKFYLSNPERPEENFAYADIIDVGNKLFIISQHSENNIQDHHKGYLTIAESVDEGKSWHNFRPMVTGFENAINVSMPSFLKVSDKHIFIFYLVKYSNKRIDIYAQESFDGCVTWSDPKAVFATNVGYQIINNARVQLIDGQIIIPVSYPVTGHIHSYSANNNALKAFYYSSADFGKTWNRSKVLSADISLLEPGLIPINNSGEWLMNIRTDHGKILFARTFDRGATWKFEQSNIVSPSSPQTLLNDSEQKALFMVWNHTDRNAASHGANRSPLTLGVSYDGGYTWRKVYDLESRTNSHDYSYVSMRKWGDKLYFVYNERNNQTGAFRVVIRSSTAELERN